MIKFTNKVLKKNNIAYFKNYLIKNHLKRFSAIGVDMGATNTCIAIVEPSGPRVIENAEGKENKNKY